MVTSTRKRATAPEPQAEEENGEATGRGVSDMHTLFSEWLKEETGEDIDPNHIFLVTSQRNKFRQSDEYLEYREKLDERRDLEKESKAAKAKARKAAAEVEDEDGDEEEAPKPAARRGRPAKATRALKAVAEDEEDEAPAKKAAPPRRRRAKAADDTF